MTSEEIEKYLNDAAVVNLATIGPSGHPHLVAMWFVMDKGDIVFWTFAKSQKVVNLRRNPIISALCESGETYEELKGVSIEGEVEFIEDYYSILAIGVALAEKQNPGSGEAAKPFLEPQAKKRIGFRIKASKIVSWDHSKLAGGY